MISKKQILPGWTLHVDEVSNNVYKVSLIDKFGREGGTTDTDLDKAISICESYAFDIERQISKNWTKFLYDTCVLKLKDKGIVENQYHDEAFGSWYILLKDRILFDGRNSVFCTQIYNINDWFDTERIEIKDLTYDKFIKAIKHIN